MKVNGSKKIEDGYKDANARYAAKNTQFFGLKLNRNTDQDILCWLDSQLNKQGAIKTAIRYFLDSHPEK